MYTKISHGTNFTGAALYDAEGLSKAQKAQKAGKVELLETNNLLSNDAPGIAQEMQEVASYSRSQKPVWNISMSAPDGVRLTAEQWQQAAAQNLRVMGAKPENHQYAIYRHSDTQQDHIHILFNSVPVDGGPALSRQFKAAKAKLAAPQLDQLLGIASHKGEGIQDEIGRKLATALSHRPTNPDELKADLAQAGVTAQYATNTKGIYGITFQLTDRAYNPVKGSDVPLNGAKAKWGIVAVRLDANRAEYEAEIERLREYTAEIEKARQIAENKRLQQEFERDILRDANEDIIADLHHKNDILGDAFDGANLASEKADTARQQAEHELDQARNQPPQVLIQEKVKEVVKPDPADKARIEQLEKEKQAISSAKAEAEKAREIADTARQLADMELREAKKEIVRVTRMGEVDLNNQDFLNKADQKRLNKEISDLKERLQAKPTEQQITDRVQEFYMIAVPDGSIPKYSTQKNAGLLSGILSNNAVPAIAAYLAHDFPNPKEAAKAIEHRFNKDWESCRTPNQGVSAGNFSFVPSDKRENWYKKPDGEQKIGWRQEPSSDAWQKLVEQKVSAHLMVKLELLSGPTPGHDNALDKAQQIRV